MNLFLISRVWGYLQGVGESLLVSGWEWDHFFLGGGVLTEEGSGLAIVVREGDNHIPVLLITRLYNQECLCGIDIVHYMLDCLKHD